MNRRHRPWIVRLFSHPRVLIYSLCLTLLPFVSHGRTDAESVDRATQYALSLDVHALNGKSLYAEHCATCHGLTAYGDPARGIPALAGQRFAYIVRQLANLGLRERDGATMHQVVAQQALRDRQTWADLAG
jgi:cytochrome c553